jgi:hypothetical protein
MKKMGHRFSPTPLKLLSPKRARKSIKNASSPAHRASNNKKQNASDRPCNPTIPSNANPTNNSLR